MRGDVVINHQAHAVEVHATSHSVRTNDHADGAHPGPSDDVRALSLPQAARKLRDAAVGIGVRVAARAFTPSISCRYSLETCSTVGKVFVNTRGNRGKSRWLPRLVSPHINRVHIRCFLFSKFGVAHGKRTHICRAMPCVYCCALLTTEKLEKAEKAVRRVHGRRENYRQFLLSPDHLLQQGQKHQWLCLPNNRCESSVGTRDRGDVVMPRKQVRCDQRARAKEVGQQCSRQAQ